MPIDLVWKVGGFVFNIGLCSEIQDRGGALIVNRERGNDPSSLLDCGLYSEREVWGGDS